MNILFKWYHLRSIIKNFYYNHFSNKSISIGKRVLYRKGFSLLVDSNAHFTIGDGCFFNNYCSIAVKKKVSIGNNTLFGENVKIYDHNHRFNNVNLPIENQGYTTAAIKIGKHCWIGSNVVILKGTVIGDNCVIGAGCIVSGNIPKNTILKVKESNFQKIKMIPHQ